MSETNETGLSPEPTRRFDRLRRRRGLGVIVVAVLALLIGRAFTDRPTGVEVVYRFGAGRASVRALEAVYYGGAQAEAGKDLGRLRWRFDESGAPAEKVHATRLTPGEHAVEITVTSAGGSSRTLHARIDVPALTSARPVIEVE